MNKTQRAIFVLMKISFIVTAIAWANVKDHFGMAERVSGLMSTSSA